DGVVAGQETAPDAEGPLAQAQVEAGGLDALLGDAELARLDVPGPDGLGQELAGQDARVGGRQIRQMDLPGHGPMMPPGVAGPPIDELVTMAGVRAPPNVTSSLGAGGRGGLRLPPGEEAAGGLLLTE